MALFGKKKSAADETVAPSAVASVSDPLGDTSSADAAPDIDPLGDGTPAPKKGRQPKAPREKKPKGGRGKSKNGMVVGLNIGNSFIKAVEVTAKNGELSVSRLAMVPTPGEAYQNGNVLSNSALSNALKALWKQGDFKSRSVVTSVAGTGALVVRVIEVPTMSDSQLADTMKLEAERYIPFPPSEVQMDFVALRDLPSDPDAGTMEVLLAAAQSEVINLHVKAIQGAKLEPTAIDVEPIALGRTLATEKRGDFDGSMVDYNEITALVNMGALSTEISLLRGDILVFTRTVSSGGNTITQAISDTLGLSFSDAERLKIDRGDAVPPAGYGTANAGDDFGLGDFGGAPAASDDFSNFGIGNDGGEPTFDVAAPAGSGSTDPFDLDFFNQGPKQNDAGAGHAQKEGDPSFNFDDSNEAILPSEESSSQTPAPAPSQAPGFDFSFDETNLPAPAPSNPALLPSNPAPPTPSPGSAPAPLSPSAFNFGPPASDLGPDFDPGLLPAVTDATQSTPATSTDSFFSMPSAFDFSDFDLPAAAIPPAPAPVAPVPNAAPTLNLEKVDEPEPQIVAPTESAPIGATGGFNFGFDENLTPSAPPALATESAPLSLAKEPDLVPQADFFAQPAPAPTSENTSGELNLDDIFGAPATSPETSSAPQTSAAPAGFDGLDFGDLDLGGNLAGGLDLGAASEDFSSFGVGLSQNTDDTDAITLYGAIEPALAEVANEISRSLSFYLERMPDVALSRVLLTGGASRLGHLSQYLTQNLGVETQIYNPITFLPSTAPGASAEFLAAAGPMYATALGLALRDFVD